MVSIWVIPFVWGFSEAVFFFFVPDVWLTWLAFSTREWDKLKIALSGALLGAVLGGILMYAFGNRAPYEQSASWLDHIPGIHRALVDSVGEQVRQGGASSVFLGILKGIPYKIYATQWGVNKGNIRLWILVSVLARGGRFLFSILVAATINKWGSRSLKSWDVIKLIVFFVFWISFYILYFNHYAH